MSETLQSLSLRLRAPLNRFFQKRRVPRHEIDDLVQDVFTRLAGRAGLESMERQEAYLFKTASNLLRDRHRRAQTQLAGQHESYDESVHDGGDPNEDPERAVLGTQQVMQLIDAMNELPAKTRIIFTLYHLEEVPHREIAQRLGIAVSTIEKHMVRAHAYLIERFKGL